MMLNCALIPLQKLIYSHVCVEDKSIVGLVHIRTIILNDFNPKKDCN